MWPHPLVRLSPDQQGQLDAYATLLLGLNKRINLIARTDTAQFRERHLWHCLCLGMHSFPAGSTVVDWGTGGGLPGIPLAILFPEVQFHLVDATGKKIQAVRHMARSIGLSNVHPWHGRADQWPGEAHYAVSRATAPLIDLWSWFARVRQPWTSAVIERCWNPGLICLKGGDLTEEISGIKEVFPECSVHQWPLSPHASPSYFNEKTILTVY